MSDDPVVDPVLVAALRDVVAERGWTLTHTGDGIFTAELPGKTPATSVSSGNPAGLIIAIDSFRERETHTLLHWPPLGPRDILHGVVDLEDVAGLRKADDNKDQEDSNG